MVAGPSRTERRTAPAAGERGQALYELLIFTSLAVLVLVSLFQLYLVNATVQRSITTAHGVLFSQVFKFNCADRRGDAACTYDTDTRGKVVWSPLVLPEVEIPVFDVFGRRGVIAERRLWSNSPLNRRAAGLGDGDYVDDAFERCEGRPCKRTKLGVGTWQSLDHVLDEAGVHVSPLARSLLYGK